jgi:hypothetical protein
LLGVVEQPVGQVVGRGVLAQPGDRCGERRAGVRVGADGGAEAGAGQVAFGPLQRGQLPGPVPVEQGEQLGSGDGVGVGEVVGGAGGQRPRPPQVLMADPEGGGVAEDGAGAAERGGGLTVGGGGECLCDRDSRLVLRVFSGPQVAQPSQDRLGGLGVTAQRRQPGPVAGQVFDVS